MRSRKTDRANRGNVMVLMVILIPVMMLVMAMGADLSHAHETAVIEKQILEDALASSQMRQEQVKFSDDPAATVRDLVQQSLERDGFSGAARITYFERADRRTAGSGEDDERHIVVEVALGANVHSTFAGFDWPVTSSGVWTMRPYASYRVFRPSMTEGAAEYGRSFLVRLEKDGATGISSGSTADDDLIGYSQLSDAAKSALDALEGTTD